LTVAAPDPAAAEAAWALVERLLADPDPKVRGAALQAAIDHDPAGAAARVGDVLERDTDPGMRAAAFGWAADHPEVPLEALAQATAYSLVDRNVESSLEAVRALAARAEAEPRERGALVAVLERLAETAAERPVRLQAAAALEALDRPAPAVGAVETQRQVEVYRDVLRRTARQRSVELETSAGTLTLRLDCPRAPMTCLNFLQLAAQGFYDGLIFHRVVPDFVVQAGDPRGDGWGGPGYTVRDEINRLRYDRGVVGMALAGADTGGSQFFITLSPQPHLDGGYTAFGRVVAGEEVLDAILPGTRIVSVTEIE
jgi:cyclophilin family peptidyl-prolyl cis-trans isomerase